MKQTISRAGFVIALLSWDPTCGAYSARGAHIRPARSVPQQRTFGLTDEALPSSSLVSRKPSKTALTASTVVPIVDRDSRRRWHHQVPLVRRFFQREPLKMPSFSIQTDASDVADLRTGFIRHKLELDSPDTLFAVGSLSVIPSIAPLPRMEPTEIVVSSGTLAPPLMTPQRRVSPFTRVSRGWLQSFLAGRFDRWSRGRHVNMDVQCDLKSGWGDIRRGKLHCDASIDVDRIIFNTIRMSGGRLEARGLALNLRSFFSKAHRRYLNQFDFYAHNVTLTQEDLMESPCIRNGLRRLLTRILNIRGMNAVFVKIEDITVLPTGKLSCLGVATTILGSRVPFEVRTGLGTSTRGHVLTFPGLELSLSSAFDFFVPILPDVTVDLGHNAQLNELRLDGRTATVQLSARVRITPDHTVHLAKKYRQSRSSYAAQCSVDVGRWLTRLGQFSL